MLDLWLDQESQIEKTAAQQFEELAEKIAVAGPEPGDGLESIKPDGQKWESSNYSEEVRSPETADQLLKRELTGRVVDEVPKTDVQQTPPRAVNTPNGRAEDKVPTVEKLKKAAALRESPVRPVERPARATPVMQKKASLKDVMIKVASSGKVRTLEGWGTRG
jgi:hypothetical protein